jgi:enoyl-[acyl-carrier protein] reductase II
MLRTSVCDLLDMEVPSVPAAIWPATSPELVPAVSEAGGLGSIGAVFESAESVRSQIARVRELTPRPFAVNHVVPLLDEAAFRATLDAEPEVISFALGNPGDLVERAHAAGAKVIHQVHTVGQAREAAELGVDAIFAQGAEAEARQAENERDRQRLKDDGPLGGIADATEDLGGLTDRLTGRYSRHHNR